ncbi:hypothetical protein [Sphaerotilus sp.]|nr:hypothetical protein [Sphaerotilus sp.]
MPAHKSPTGRDAGREIDYSDPAPKRNEHCPPYVYVGTAKWDARFQFSF